jgi:Cys-tRNA(Pro) deacylase
MNRPREPVTQAVRELRAAGVPFEGHPYRYVTGGGTAQFARELDIDEYLVIKTLIMEDDAGGPLVVLMHGDRQVSLRELARQIGARQVQPCIPAVADRHSGYQVGGTSPFGTRRRMPIYCEASIAGLPRVYVNGGKRGYIISLATSDLLRVLEPVLVHVAQPSG